jgi:hypothetical protein
MVVGRRQGMGGVAVSQSPISLPRYSDCGVQDYEFEGRAG